MIERPLVREHVDEAEIDPVDRNRPGNGLQARQSPHLLEPAARLLGLLQQGHRQPARHTEMAPALLRHPSKHQGLGVERYPPGPKQFVQVAEGDGRVDLRRPDRGGEPRVHHLEPVRVSRPEIAGLGHRGRRHRRQIGDQLGILGPHRLDHHRVGRPDHGAPGLLPPQPEILRGHQLVPNHPARHHPEPGRITGVDHLLRGGRIEMGRALGVDNDRPGTLGRNRHGLAQLAADVDRVVGTLGNTEAAVNTDLLHDPNPRRVRCHGDCIRRAHPHARQAGDAAIVVNDEFHGFPDRSIKPIILDLSVERSLANA